MSDISPVVDTRERRDVRGIRDELGVENSSWGETGMFLTLRDKTTARWATLGVAAQQYKVSQGADQLLQKTHLLRLRRLRALGVRSKVPDVSPVVDARERRDARGMRDELGVENSSWGETGTSLASREWEEGEKRGLGQSCRWKPNVCNGGWQGVNAAELKLLLLHVPLSSASQSSCLTHCSVCVQDGTAAQER